MNTINKSELMRKAWAIASLLTGDISARLSYALKKAREWLMDDPAWDPDWKE